MLRINTRAISPVMKAAHLQAHHTLGEFRWGQSSLSPGNSGPLIVRLTNQASETPRMPSIARVSDPYGMCSVGTINTNPGKA